MRRMTISRFKGAGALIAAAVLAAAAPVYVVPAGPLRHQPVVDQQERRVIAERGELVGAVSFALNVSFVYADIVGLGAEGVVRVEDLLPVIGAERPAGTGDRLLSVGPVPHLGVFGQGERGVEEAVGGELVPDGGRLRVVVVNGVEAAPAPGLERQEISAFGRAVGDAKGHRFP